MPVNPQSHRFASRLADGPTGQDPAARPSMSGESAIDTVVKRLALALDALDAAVERRREGDRNENSLAAQVQTLGLDRARLAAALDGEPRPVEPECLHLG